MKNPLMRRVEALEAKAQIGTISIRLASGDSVQIARRGVLGLILGAFRRRHAEIEDLPRPESRFDGHLDAIEQSAVVSPGAPLIASAGKYLHPTDR
jgi:hypothetical protein